MISFPQRKSPRLQGYDYAQSGAYFVTICTQDRAHLFGEIVDGEMQLSAAGQIAQERWFALPDHHLHVALDAFVVMPNHVHGILLLVGAGSALPGERAGKVDAGDAQADNAGIARTIGAGDVKADNAGIVPTLGTVVGSYKSGVTRRIREAYQQPEMRVWQGRYHDHIVRDLRDANRIRAYIATNPARWQSDVFYGNEA